MNNELIKKFSIEKFDKKLILDKPEDIHAFDGIAYDTDISKDKYDLIFAFIFSLDTFTNLVKTVITQNLLNANGILYFAYPKKGNRQYQSYIGRDDFFHAVTFDNDGFILDSPIKFNTMAAFDNVFTIIGLKHETKKKKSTQPSQCVSDYVEHIPVLRERLVKNKDLLTFFDKLTPGYQSGWSRYVFGVKNPATVRKRLAEMEQVLSQGYKSIDLYRRDKKQLSS